MIDPITDWESELGQIGRGGGEEGPYSSSRGEACSFGPQGKHCK